MKKIFTIMYTGICLSLFFKMNAQDYLPIVKENAEWTVLKITINTQNPNPPYPKDTSYVTTFIQGDTIIAGILFKKVFSREFSPGDNVPIYKGAIREENKIVTWIAMEQSVEQLDTLYNFNLQVGDTLATFTHMSSFYFYVQSIDLLTLVDGSKRKRINVNVRYTASPNYEERVYSWAEGIGNIEKGLISPFCTETSNPRCLDKLICYKENNAIIYESPPLACSLTSAYLTPQYHDLKLFPNPFNNYISINATTISEMNIKIYDVLGRCVLNKIHDFNFDNSLNLELDSLEKGLYFLVIYDEKKFISKTIIKQ